MSPNVFISGAAAGIGRATALTFARHGYRVGAYDVDLAGLATLREEGPVGAVTSRSGISTSPTPRTGRPNWRRSPARPADSTSW